MDYDPDHQDITKFFRRFKQVGKMNKLESPNVDKALIFLDDKQLFSTSNAVERGNRRHRKMQNSDRCFTAWHGDALNMDELAQKLTGKPVEGRPDLWDVFPPRHAGDVPLEDVTSRGSTRQIFAQFEAFLTRPAG